MASPLTPLTRLARQLATQSIGRAVDWYVGRGYSSSSIVNKLISRGFNETRATVGQLIGFSASKISAANSFNRKSANSVIAAASLPSAVVNPSNVRVRYRINIEDGDTEKDVFGGLVADCDDGLTKQELIDCVNKAADNFLNYYDYDVKRYTIDIEDISGF